MSLQNMFTFVYKCFLGLILITFSLFAQESISARVVKVVDGDTITASTLDTNTNVKVRLLNLDAPETNYFGHNQGTPAQEAKEYLKEMLPVGTLITIVSDKTQIDLYGRTLGIIYKDDLDINYALLISGLAVTYLIYPNISNAPKYVRATEYAQQNRLGIFKEEVPEMPYEFRLRISGHNQGKFVGDFDQKFYVIPKNYRTIEIPYRIFFDRSKDAVALGFSYRP